jgi:hypothetical protein
MKLHMYFIALSLPGLFLGSPVRGLANDNFPNQIDPSTADFVIDESAQREAEPFDIVEVDHCYMGSNVDPATGEIFDLYVLCSDDAVSDNLDLA